MRPPPWRDVAGRPQNDGWPLHVKNVSPIDLVALGELQVIDAEVMAKFKVSLDWITEPLKYQGLATSLRAPAARLSESDVQKMLEVDQIRHVNPNEVRGGVILFPVEEPAKTRRRCIKHTRDINDFFGKDTLQKVTQPTRTQQSVQSGSGPFAITLDFAAWFDQFPLHEQIGTRMCFKSGQNTYRLCRMPMGQRQAVEVAQGATNVLLSFTLPQGVSTQSCIDNVRFVGPTAAAVIDAATTFVKRCRSVGCTINELPSANSSAQDGLALKECVHQQGDWLGAEYDYIRGRQRVAAKSISKLAASWSASVEWTARNYAAHIGLLFFATSVLRLNVGKFFQAMKMYRQRSSALADGGRSWNERVFLAPSEKADLEAWTREATNNAWVACADPAPPRRFIATDASEWGWGAIFLDLEAGIVNSCSVPWSLADRTWLDVNHSAYAEPEAVFRALCRFIAPASTAPVAILTDSTTAKYALPRGYSPSHTVNMIAARCRERFPMIRLDTFHIAGVANEVDPLSRGRMLVEEEEALMRRMMGAVGVRGGP